MAFLAPLLLIGVVALTSHASAITYETAPAFCEPRQLRDFTAPLERMPELHQPSEREQIGFGPESLRLLPAPSLVFGEGAVGVTLALYQSRDIRLPWTAAATLVKVDRKGRRLGKPRRSVERVGQLRPYYGKSFSFEVPAASAFYRVTIVLRKSSGKKLGKFGFYYRVLRSAQRARLRLNAPSYRPESTVFGRVENFGADYVSYGVAYSIERLEGETWVRAPESPRGPWIAIGLSSPPHATGASCSGFRIPASMAPGRYRMVKDVDFPPWPSGKRLEQTLTAEFDVVP